MSWCSPRRPAGRLGRGFARSSLAALLVGLFASGCLPELEGQCSVNGDCPAERPICLAQVCTPRLGESDGTPSDGPLPTDGGEADLAQDAGPDGAAVDRGPCAPTGPETCNGLDDDCDGEIDEVAGGQPLSRPCYTGAPDTQGIGVCRAGRATCIDGSYGACEGEVAPREEVCAEGDPDCAGLCNGEDDDCDGAVDEALARACGPEAEIGLCRRGSEACTDGFWQACEGAVPPAVEICDGLDNDCDLQVDEGNDDCECVGGESRGCYSGAPGTQGVGVCADGLQDCGDGGTFGQCFDEITPLPERCDGADNDCDGTADERLGGQPCTVGRGACLSQGETVCDAEARRERCDAEAGEPQEELCNGVDDDCDGTADEGFRLGEACGRGMGACRVVGERVCLEGRAVCDAVAGEPMDERCNGQDDDCDGTTDENAAGDGPLEQSCYEQEGGNPGVGACVEGIQACADGRWGQCVGDQQPFPERCNGEDDDCNGEIDDVEGGDCSCTVGQQQPCYGGPEGTNGMGVCRSGMQRCVELDGGGTGFGPCEGEVLPGDELCNRQDEDCDGAIDEGGFGVCVAGQGACAVDGVQRCVDGALRCDAEGGAPGDEVCNGEDDDCNGLVDDIAAEACEVGVGICRNTGMLRCGPQGAECDVVPGEPLPAEICNSADDDCDGETDEMVPGGMCTVGVGACARDGRQACLDGVAVCEGDPGAPGVEMCNGEDDDCDGAVDEGDFGDCTVGMDDCVLPGAVDCVDGVPLCVAVGEPPVEVCNGADDDCDGATDEDPQAICGDVPNGSAECRGGECGVVCDARYYNPDGDPDNGCERGCDPRLDGQVIAATGAPLAVAARPDGDEFAIAWLDQRGAPWMSIEGGAPFAIGGDDDLRALTIQIIGVRHGYSVLLRGRATAHAVDVRVVGGAPDSIQIFGGVGGVPGLTLLVREPAPAAPDDGVPGIVIGGAINPEAEGGLSLAPRTFGADFGAAAPLAFAQAGWVGSTLSTTTVGDRTLLVGVASGEREISDIRAIFLDGNTLARTQVRAPVDDQVRTAVAARGATVVVGVSNGQGMGMYGFQVGAMVLGAPVQAGAGQVIGAQYGPAGPVVSSIENRDLVSFGVRYRAGALEPVYGPLQVATQGQGSAGMIDTAAATLTAGDRRIVVWRDRQAGVRWAENPCF